MGPAVGAKTTSTGGSRLDVMNVLNEIAGEFPEAISFASGRPAEAFFEIERWLDRIPEFVSHYAARQSVDRATAFNSLAQYGKTNGVINDLIAAQLGHDEGIRASGDQLVVTAGCQEAMALCLTELCDHPNDVVLVRNPTYIGITGVAELHGIELVPICCDDGDDFYQGLVASVAAAERRGKKPRAAYLIPEFDNPTGSVLEPACREQVLAYCASSGIVVLEDNPYGMFRYEGERTPSMYALDKVGCVIYLGTYSKTLCPAVRVGFALVPPRLFGKATPAQALRARLSQRKSFVTVNTSQIMQALVGGVLLVEGGSLARVIQPALYFYRRNRDRMLTALAAAFPAGPGAPTWNMPKGGFFLNVSLPFPFRQREAEICARDYAVLTLPLTSFALNDAHAHSVRLAFSNVAPEQIDIGIERFALFVRDCQAGRHAPD